MHPVCPGIQAKSGNRRGKDVETSLRQHSSIVTGIRRRVIKPRLQVLLFSRWRYAEPEVGHRVTPIYIYLWAFCNI